DEGGYRRVREVRRDRRHRGSPRAVRPRARVEGSHPDMVGYVERAVEPVEGHEHGRRRPGADRNAREPPIRWPTGYRGRDLREGRAPVFREVQAAIDGAEVDDARRRDRDLGDGGDWRSLWAPIYARRRRITIDGPPDPVGTGEQCGRVRRIHGKK